MGILILELTFHEEWQSWAETGLWSNPRHTPHLLSHSCSSHASVAPSAPPSVPRRLDTRDRCIASRSARPSSRSLTAPQFSRYNFKQIKSNAGVRADLFDRTRLTDFFGGVAQAEVVDAALGLGDGGTIVSAPSDEEVALWRARVRREVEGDCEEVTAEVEEVGAWRKATWRRRRVEAGV